MGILSVFISNHSLLEMIKSIEVVVYLHGTFGDSRPAIEISATTEGPYHAQLTCVSVSCNHKSPTSPKRCATNSLMYYTCICIFVPHYLIYSVLSLKSKLHEMHKPQKTSEIVSYCHNKTNDIIVCAPPHTHTRHNTTTLYEWIGFLKVLSPLFQ